MKAVPPELLRAPFTVAHAAELGLSADVLRGRRFRAPFPGVRVPATLPDTLQTRCAAAALVLAPVAAFSHETAALLHGLPTPFGTDPFPMHASLPAGSVAPQIAGITAHRVQWARDDVVLRRGLRVTSSARTWCDLASRGWQTCDLVVCADFMLRWQGPRGRELLAAATARWGGRRGAVALRAALALAEFRVDSPMETRLRLLLIQAGLPVPQVNCPVRDADGVILHTPDLSWPRWRVAVDYDGAHHFVAGGEQGDWRRRQDAARQELLQEEGWTLRIMTAADVLRRPHQAVERTTRALLAAGARW